MFVSFSHNLFIIHCINVEYTGRCCLLISVLDKFCHVDSLLENGIWYVLSKCFFLIPFAWQYCDTHTYRIYSTIYLDLYMHYLLSVPLKNHV